MYNPRTERKSVALAHDFGVKSLPSQAGLSITVLNNICAGDSGPAPSAASHARGEERESKSDSETALSAGLEVKVVINTLPGSVPFTLPSFMLNQRFPKHVNNGLIVMDVNYLPKQTSVLSQCHAHNASVSASREQQRLEGEGEHEEGRVRGQQGAVRPVVTAKGIDMLIEQGFAQFETWTGMP